MSPGAQATTVEVDGVVITAISTKSPLGTAVLGKKKGDKVTFSVGEVEVLGVW